MTMFASMASAAWSQWVAGVLCAFAAFWTWRGAMAGSQAHRMPRVALACVLTFLTGFYVLLLCKVITDPTVASAILRGVAFVMYPTIAWVSITGIRYARKVHKMAALLDGTETEDVWKRHG